VSESGEDVSGARVIGAYAEAEGVRVALPRCRYSSRRARVALPLCRHERLRQRGALARHASNEWYNVMQAAPAAAAGAAEKAKRVR